MDIETENFIFKQWDILSANNQKIICNIIAEAMEPFIYLKKDNNLQCIYHEYLKRIWETSSTETNLYYDYMRKIKHFFELSEYDEDSYKSYDDNNFFEYLSYMATLSLGNVLNSSRATFSKFSLYNLIEVSEVLDDYFYFKNKDKVEVNGIQEILQNLSQRIMQNSCEKLLRNSIQICLNSNYKDKKQKLKNNLKDYVDNLNMVLDR